MSKHLQINKSDIVIRPSSIAGFYGCQYQWAKRYLEGVPQGKNGSRSSIGTSIHSGVEQFWDEVKSSKDREVFNLATMTDRAVQTFKEQIDGEGVEYGKDENENTCVVEIARGVETFADDIGQFVMEPDVVEQYLEVKLDHPLVTAVGGTLDYRAGKTLADVKTSKRKVSPQAHVVQQSTYKYLCEANGHEINNCTIQGIVLRKASADGMVLPLDPNVSQAKFLINGILDRIDVALKDVMPLHVLFAGNPKYMFCSRLYCELHETCPFVIGEDLEKIQVAM